MNIYLQKVKEFMLTFGQPVLDKPTPLPEDRQKLRIALIFEELKEYAEASGQLDYFNLLCNTSHKNFYDKLEAKNITYVPIVNQVEQLDALLDLQYVLSGAVHEHGFGEIFDEGFDEVHRSNMSKVDYNIPNAIITQKKYLGEGINTYYKLIPETGDYVTYRTEDNKVLKSHRYKSAQLAQFLK